MIENLEQLLDVMAHEICDYYDDLPEWRSPVNHVSSDRDFKERDDVRMAVRASLLAAQAEGAEMVPGEASEAMQDAWLEQQNAVLKRSGGYAVNCSEQYRAMLAASPLRLEGEESGHE